MKQGKRLTHLHLNWITITNINLYSGYNQSSEPSEKQESGQHSSDYSLLQEPTTCNRSPGAENINNIAYSKKTNWTQANENLTPKI